MKKYDYWHGLRGIYFVWNGICNDPELFVKLPNKVICVASYWAVENYFYNYLKEERPELDANNGDIFHAYLKENKQSIKDYIMEIGEYFKTC